MLVQESIRTSEFNFKAAYSVFEDSMSDILKLMLFYITVKFWFNKFTLYGIDIWNMVYKFYIYLSRHQYYNYQKGVW